MQLVDNLQDVLPQLRPQGPSEPEVEADRDHGVAPAVVRKGESQRRVRGRPDEHPTLQPLSAVGTGKAEAK